MTRSEELEEQYVAWLWSQVESGKQSYEALAQAMFEKEFVWFIPNDDNRCEDGLDLRTEFMQEMGSTVALRYLSERGCSVLEVVIALSRRLSFAADGSPAEWAWTLIKNLELNKMKDPVGHRRLERIDAALEMLIWRTYAKDGQGGLFPLAWPDQDQTKVELWYQMSAFLNEIHEM